MLFHLQSQLLYSFSLHLKFILHSPLGGVDNNGHFKRHFGFYASGYVFLIILNLDVPGSKPKNK